MSATSARLAQGLAIAVCLALLSCQAASLPEPIVGEHAWRQSDTYAVARNFLRVSADFFHPRIDWSSGRSGIMGMEAPIYPYVTFLAMRVFGESPATARCVGWSCFLLGLLSFCGMLHETAGSAQAVAFALMLLLSPLVLFETRQVQPDGPALGLLLASAAAFRRHSVNGRARTYSLAMACYTAAVLIRPQGLLVAPAMWLLSRPVRPAAMMPAIRRAVWFAVPSGCFLLWAAWAYHLNVVYDEGRHYFFGFGSSLSWTAMKDNLQNAAALCYVFGSLFPTYLVNWTLLPALVVGVVATCGEWQRLAAAFWAWLLGALVLCCVFSPSLYFHPYYATLAVPPLAYFASLGWLALLRLATVDAPQSWRDRWAGIFVALTLAASTVLGGDWESWKSLLEASSPLLDRTWIGTTGFWVGSGLAVAAVLIAWPARRWSGALGAGLLVLAFGGVARGAHDALQTFASRARLNEWRTFEEDWDPLRKAVDCYANPRETVVTDGGQPWTLYLAERPGYAERASEIARQGLSHYRARGARLLVHFRTFDELPVALGLTSPMETGPKWELHCIDPNGCAARPSCRPVTATTSR